MPLRNWSSKRLTVVWLLGIGMEFTLLAGMAAYSRLTETPREHEMRVLSERSEREWRAYEDSVDRGLAEPPKEITAEQKAAIKALFRDSLGFTWETRGKVTTIKGPPAFDSVVRQVTTGLGKALLFAAALYLTIPIALVVLTLSWTYVRRPWQRRSTSGG